MKKLRFHCLQHISFEGPGIIEKWALENGHSFTFTRFYENDQLPALDDFDFLIIMGGPMSYDDDDIYWWMRKEKAFLKEAIKAGKAALGICLGSQFLAIAAGASGAHGTQQEVGWFPIQFFNQEKTFNFLPDNPTVFQWHGDTFELPKGVVHFAGTKLFPNQGFILNKKIVGLQFHLEVEPASVEAMLQEVGHLIPDQEFTQTPDEIRKENRYYSSNQQWLIRMIEQIAGEI